MSWQGEYQTDIIAMYSGFCEPECLSCLAVKFSILFTIMPGLARLLHPPACTDGFSFIFFPPLQLLMAFPSFSFLPFNFSWLFLHFLSSPSTSHGFSFIFFPPLQLLNLSGCLPPRCASPATLSCINQALDQHSVACCTSRSACRNYYLATTPAFTGGRWRGLAFDLWQRFWVGCNLHEVGMM